ncbi:unnamed protein product, partial [Allacma fusca]
MSQCSSSSCQSLAKVNKSHDEQNYHTEVEEDPVDFLTAAVFGIPLIFLEILVNLDVPDLLNCSLV